MQLQFVYLQRKEKKSFLRTQSLSLLRLIGHHEIHTNIVSGKCKWTFSEVLFPSSSVPLFRSRKTFFWRTNRDELNLKKKKKKKKDEGRRTFHQLLQALPIHNTSRFTQCPSSHFFIISPYCPKTKRNNRNNSKNSHRLMTNDIEFFSG